MPIYRSVMVAGAAGAMALFAGAADAVVVVTQYTSLSTFQSSAAGTVASFGFGRLTASPSTTYGSIAYNHVVFSANNGDTTVKVLTGNTDYGANKKFIEASVPKDSTTNGNGKTDELLLTFKAGVSAVGFDVGTDTLTADKNIQVVVDYKKVRTGDTGMKTEAPAIATPAAGDYFLGYTVPAGYEITSILVSENGTKRSGTALDISEVYTNGTVVEPDAWALLLVGAGLTGAAIRRRRTAVLAI